MERLFDDTGAYLQKAQELDKEIQILLREIVDKLSNVDIVDLDYLLHGAVWDVMISERLDRSIKKFKEAKDAPRSDRDERG